MLFLLQPLADVFHLQCQLGNFHFEPRSPFALVVEFALDLADLLFELAIPSICFGPVLTVLVLFLGQLFTGLVQCFKLFFGRVDPSAAFLPLAGGFCTF